MFSCIKGINIYVKILKILFKYLILVSKVLKCPVINIAKFSSQSILFHYIWNTHEFISLSFVFNQQQRTL